ncbi:Lrp/AsnC family transcriptional regulator [Haladaptatus sp. NG-SE-30]
MAGEPLNDLDRRILHLLQVDARGTTDAEIGDETDVTGTTVANRIEKLEDQGIIRGYHPDIDYEQADYPLVILFVCTAPLAERSDIADQARDVLGVVNIRETMGGEQNLHVKAVADSTERIERIAQHLDELGLTIHRSDLMAHETVQPWNHFHLEDSRFANESAGTDDSEEE